MRKVLQLIALAICGLLVSAPALAMPAAAPAASGSSVANGARTLQFSHRSRSQQAYPHSAVGRAQPNSLARMVSRDALRRANAAAHAAFIAKNGPARARASGSAAAAADGTTTDDVPADGVTAPVATGAAASGGAKSKQPGGKPAAKKAAQTPQAGGKGIRKEVPKSQSVVTAKAVTDTSATRVAASGGAKSQQPGAKPAAKKTATTGVQPSTGTKGATESRKERRGKQDQRSVHDVAAAAAAAAEIDTTPSDESGPAGDIELLPAQPADIDQDAVQPLAPDQAEEGERGDVDALAQRPVAATDGAHTTSQQGEDDDDASASEMQRVGTGDSDDREDLPPGYVRIPRDLARPEPVRWGSSDDGDNDDNAAQPGQSGMQRAGTGGSDDGPLLPGEVRVPVGLKRPSPVDWKKLYDSDDDDAGQPGRAADNGGPGTDDD